MKNKTKTILCTLAVAGVLGTSGILAYLTDNDSAKNEFTIGKVDIDLVEDTWDEALDNDGENDADENDNNIPDFAENITPNQTITKDPKVKNVGINDAFVYLEVKVPFETVITAQDDGTRNAEAATELFTFEANSGWTQLSRTEGTDEVTYVYCYDQKVAPNSETTTLFDSVTVANVIEGEIDATTQDIDIKAYAIQSDNLPNGTTATPQEAYQIYVNQNTNN